MEFGEKLQLVDTLSLVFRVESATRGDGSIPYDAPFVHAVVCKKGHRGHISYRLALVRVNYEGG